MSAADGRTTLERKEDAELQKLEAEARKARAEAERATRRWSPAGVLSGFVSGAAVIVSAAQVWMAWTAHQSSVDLATAESRLQQTRTAADTALRCMDTALKTADYAIKLRDDFVKASADPTRQLAIMNVVIATFPPATARRILQAAASEGGGSPTVLARYDEARTELPTHDDVTSCPTSEVVLQSAFTPQDVPASLPTNVALAAPGCPTTGPQQAIPLLVFPQIVRAQDREAARRVLAGLVQIAPGTKVQAVDTVPARNPQNATAQVRYYFPDQADTASALAKLLDAAGCLAGVPGVGKFDTRYIGGNFSGLRRDRIEVWFPALNQPS
ncbi:MAG: hypothetical protein RQ966_06210 [Acetobacteraceae bacterium]|nr:hypothetical protein [Acetobacteraceae bacterium]